MTPSPDPIVPIPPATTLSYEQSNTLMQDFTFRGRVKVGCLHFADYIVDEPANVPAHNTRLKWAQSCFQNPDMIAAQIQPAVVMDGEVQQTGSVITDNALQTTVETVVNKML